jgi:hypothetical protein
MCAAGEGTEGCACRGGDQCDDGLFCDEGMCRPQGEITIVVGDPSARSCEALVEERAGEVFDAEFTGALGAFVHEAPRASITFASTSDSAFAENAVRLRHSEGADLVLARGQCFDRDGAPIAGNNLSLR